MLSTQQRQSVPMASHLTSSELKTKRIQENPDYRHHVKTVSAGQDSETKSYPSHARFMTREQPPSTTGDDQECATNTRAIRSTIATANEQSEQSRQTQHLLLHSDKGSFTNEQNSGSVSIRRSKSRVAVVEHKYKDHAWKQFEFHPWMMSSRRQHSASWHSDLIPTFCEEEGERRDLDSLPSNFVCFPERLYEMLRETQIDPDLRNIVGWQPHGRSFLVRKPRDFVSSILSKYFRQSKFTSFQRQLNLYGFKRLTREGPDKGAYYHELFLRGRPVLCRYIRRTCCKGLGVKPAPSPQTEPNFYAMIACHESDKMDGQFPKSVGQGSLEAIAIHHQGFPSIGHPESSYSAGRHVFQDYDKTICDRTPRSDIRVGGHIAPFFLTNKVSTTSSSASYHLPQDKNERTFASTSPVTSSPVVSFMTDSKRNTYPLGREAINFKNTSCSQHRNYDDLNPDGFGSDSEVRFHVRTIQTMDTTDHSRTFELNNEYEEEGKIDPDLLRLLADGAHML